MESTFASRVRQYRQGKGLSQQAFAELCGLTQGNIAHMENGTEPKQSNVSKLLAGLPSLNPDWLLMGSGPMLRDGRSLTPAPPDEPTPTPSAGLVVMEEPAIAYRQAAPVQSTLGPDVLDKLLNQINSAAQQHREELAALKKEHKANLAAHIRLMQSAANVMAEKIHYMEGRLGLRPLTAAETTAQQAVEAPRAKKIGLKHYDESAPTGSLGRHLHLFASRYMETSAALAA